MAEQTHFSAVIIFREREGRLEVLVQPYLWRGQRQAKFPGGMNEKGETPIQTAVRELAQETFLRVAEGSLAEVYTNSPNPDHTKHFFVANERDIEGELRGEPLADNGGEVLEPPEWSEVTKGLYGGLFGHHKEGFRLAMLYKASQLASFGWYASRLNLV